MLNTITYGHEIHEAAGIQVKRHMTSDHQALDVQVWDMDTAELVGFKTFHRDGNPSVREMGIKANAWLDTLKAERAAA